MFKTIKSPSNPLIKQIVKIRKDKKYRNEKSQVLIVGKKELFEIKKTKLSIDTLIATNKEVIEKHKAKKNIFTTKAIMKKITNVSSPEDVCAIIDIKERSLPKNPSKVLILDKISDPGNLGTLIRSANAFEFDLVVVSADSVDPYNEKVLRAAKGSIFLIPIKVLELKEIEPFISKNDLSVYLADITGENFLKTLIKKPYALILSNESQGPSNWTKKLKKKSITISMKKSQESLNVAVAGSILMFYLRDF